MNTMKMAVKSVEDYMIPLHGDKKHISTRNNVMEGENVNILCESNVTMIYNEILLVKEAQTKESSVTKNLKNYLSFSELELQGERNLLPWTRIEISELTNFQNNPERLWKGRVEFVEKIFVSNSDVFGMVPHPLFVLGDKKLYNSAFSDSYFHIFKSAVEEQLNDEGCD